jgi:YfiH family protein
VDAVLPGARLVSVHQIHSATVVEAGDWPDDNRPPADALVTDRPGILLGILTADCAPILFADREAGVVAAAHSGWRGALAGVNEATVEAMEKHGAHRERIAAAIGPAIAARNYEVDHAFPEPFLKADPANERFFSDDASFSLSGGQAAAAHAGKPHFDLEGFVAARLAAAGIRKVEALGLDTYADAERFYSFRRATHRGEPDYGRQVSLIGLPG